MSVSNSMVWPSSLIPDSQDSNTSQPMRSCATKPETQSHRPTSHVPHLMWHFTERQAPGSLLKHHKSKARRQIITNSRWCESSGSTKGKPKVSIITSSWPENFHERCHRSTNRWCELAVPWSLHRHCLSLDTTETSNQSYAWLTAAVPVQKWSTGNQPYGR